MSKHSCLSQIHAPKLDMIILFQKTNNENTYQFVDLGRLYLNFSVLFVVLFFSQVALMVTFLPGLYVKLKDEAAHCLLVYNASVPLTIHKELDLVQTSVS